MEKFEKGLEGVIAAQSSICFIDGVKGDLLYRGYSIHDLAEHSTFEETCYLLFFGKLPTKKELKEFSNKLKDNRELPKIVIKRMKTFPKNLPPMAVLRTVTSALSFNDEKADDNSEEENIRKAINLIAKFPTIVSTYDNLRNDRKIMKPKRKLNHAANFLYMLTGNVPDEISAKAIDLDLLLTAEHELNASTFSALVTTSTLSDIYSSVTSAVGTLKGVLHGGARRGVMETLLKIGSPDRVDSYLRDALARKEKIMGFGHRVYKAMDPRAIEFRQFCKEFVEKKDGKKWFEMTERIENILLKNPTFIEKKLFPNVDFYPPVIYLTLGIPKDLADSIFAIARTPGWCAHIMEQLKDNRLIRPLAEYTGSKNLKYVKINSRK